LGDKVSPGKSGAGKAACPWRLFLLTWQQPQAGKCEPNGEEDYLDKEEQPERGAPLA